MCLGDGSYKPGRPWGAAATSFPFPGPARLIVGRTLGLGDACREIRKRTQWCVPGRAKSCIPRVKRTSNLTRPQTTRCAVLDNVYQANKEQIDG